ncbi:response regulator [Daejeonella lutea]|uniref:Response regulator receiver domain-containing protein n=1 Tax=Daejeonella lutea TaxID=572036 RepID=A0A1T5BIG4_9SPHI|nr:response regulator [Daejeonella lutea]SKB47036.1 Response regulator receiver domain-containing protein [Daejeonella lutea]
MKRVLVVDDNQEILDVIKILMELNGYEVKCINSGLNLSDSVIDYDPNIILLDIVLGDIDGRDLCRYLKGDPRTQHIPIIIISASDTIYSAGEKTCNAETFIPKPFDIQYLLTQVETYVN